MKKKLSVYDKRDFYNGQVKPLVLEIRKLCKVNHLPFFFASAVDNSERKKNGGGTGYVLDGVLPGSEQLNLENDMFRKYVLLSRGVVDITFPTQDEYSEEYLDYYTPDPMRAHIPLPDENPLDELDDELADAEETDITNCLISIGDL